MTRAIFSVALFAVVVRSLPAADVLPAVDIETLQPIAPVASVQKTAEGIVLTCADSSQVSIRVLARDLVRVRASFRQPLPERDHSWAVAKTSWAATSWKLVERPDEVSVTTEAVEVAVHRSPLLVEFRDPVTHKVISAEDRPMLYDPKSPAIADVRKLGFEEHFYGLGEKAASLDKRRGRFTMWNTDAYRFAEGTDPVYQSIPFYLGWQGGDAYGLFYDNSFRTSFDFGSKSEDLNVFTAPGGPMSYYFFAGPSMKDIVGRYTELTGRIPMPPRWALGNQQSRYTYYPAAEVMKVADTYRAHDLPLDAINLDINYMNGYRDFTWDPKRFPDPRKMMEELGKKGVKVVTIVDPGIKSQPEGGYSAYDEGKEKDYFLKRTNGQLYIGKVWPGEAVFVDYTLDKAARWWGGLLKAYTDNGVAGIWTDMNEPSDFIDQTGATQMDVVSYDGDTRSTYAGNRNLFALGMARATYEGLERLRPNDRPFVITRAGFAGIQRYATMWTGDNSATWESLALTIPMFESLGLSGESFVGADVGGFAGRSNGQLLTRWYEAGFLAPFLRNHGEMGTYDHEPWRFGTYYENIIRKYLKLRYRLLPFLYSAVEEAHRTGMPVIRPLLLNYQHDTNALTNDDEFMAGSDLLVAPVLKPDAESRSVYLPAGTWFDYWTGERLVGGRTIRVQAPLETVPLFVRGGAVLPLGPEMNWTGEKPVDPLTFDVYPDDKDEASGSLYEDDGTTVAYKSGVFRRTSVRARSTASGLEIDLQRAGGDYRVSPRQIILAIRGKVRAAHACSVDGASGGCDFIQGPEGGVQVRIRDDGENHRIVVQ